MILLGILSSATLVFLLVWLKQTGAGRLLSQILIMMVTGILLLPMDFLRDVTDHDFIAFRRESSPLQAKIMY